MATHVSLSHAFCCLCVTIGVWDSRNVTATWNWNVMDVGPKRDLLGDFVRAVRKVRSPHTGRPLPVGIYHSLFEWYNPLYQLDKKNQFQTQHFVINKALPELYDLVQQYQPELLWSDGDGEATSDYWKSREFLAWYRNQSAVAVWNDRWGSDVMCRHGSFLTCQDRYNPNVYQKRKFENALTIDQSSWGYNRNSTHLSIFLTVPEIIHPRVQVVAMNGNMLLSFGPNADGTMDPIFLDRLHGVGRWLAVNGAAIYSTQPWSVCQNETSSVYYTRNEHRLYAIFVQWPKDNTLSLHCVTATDTTEIHFLGLDHGPIPFATRRPNTSQHRRSVTGSSGGIQVLLPALTPDILPCAHAWALEITGWAL